MRRMIYILNACQGVFSLPGMACSACGEACKSCPGACGAICNPIRGCFTGCGASFKQFTERPLSTYVVVSLLVSAGSIYLSYEALNNRTPGITKPTNATAITGAGDGEACTSTFLYIVMGFAVINVVFAWFLQNQVWKEIMRHEEEFIDGDKPGETWKGRMPAAATGAMGMMDKATGGKAAPMVPVTPVDPPPMNPGKIIIPKNITQDAFKKTFMEDFVVLIMFVALMGMFVLSWKGQDTVDGKDKEKGVCKTVGQATYCGYAYFWTACAYSVAYYCCACCSASVTMKKTTKEEDESLE